MADTRISRRRFVLAGIAASGMFVFPHRWLPGGVADADGMAGHMFSQFAKRLFPHAGLADDVYEEIAESLSTSLAIDPLSARLLDTADDALNARTGGSWIDASKERQVAALKAIEGEAFFAAILAAVRGAFYEHPTVWMHLDYPGSSKEHGGYKHRGFDDIDWLPEGE